MLATSKALLIALALLAAPAFSAPPVQEETAVQILPLAAPLNSRAAELSGLAWYGDELVLLPQFARDELWTLQKTQLYAAIAATTPVPLGTTRLPLDTGNVLKQVPGFEGFEAITFHGDMAYLALECELRGKMSAWLVRGVIVDGVLRLEDGTLTEVPLPAQVFNMAIEALTVLKDQLVVFFEANGGNIVAPAQALVYDFDLNRKAAVPLATIEYRTTDATAVDTDGRLWVSNYLWPGERRLLNPAADGFAKRFGVGSTHAKSATVERLIELHATETGIFQTKRAPIYLALDPASGRNWEGLVRLDDAGFLVVSDSHPATLLGFVPTR